MTDDAKQSKKGQGLFMQFDECLLKTTLKYASKDFLGSVIALHSVEKSGKSLVYVKDLDRIFVQKVNLEVMYIVR